MPIHVGKAAAFGVVVQFEHRALEAARGIRVSWLQTPATEAWLLVSVGQKKKEKWQISIRDLLPPVHPQSGCFGVHV